MFTPLSTSMWPHVYAQVHTHVFYVFFNLFIFAGPVRYIAQGLSLIQIGLCSWYPSIYICFLVIGHKSKQIFHISLPWKMRQWGNILSCNIMDEIFVWYAWPTLLCNSSLHSILLILGHWKFLIVRFLTIMNLWFSLSR